MVDRYVVASIYFVPPPSFILLLQLYFICLTMVTSGGQLASVFVRTSDVCP